MKVKKERDVDTRRSEILHYLRSCPDQTALRKDLLQRFDISNPTLTEDLQVLESQGFSILKTRGKVSLSSEYKDLTYARIKPGMIRKFFLLLLLRYANDRPCTLQELVEYYLCLSYDEDLHALMADSHEFNITNHANQFSTPEKQKLQFAKYQRLLDLPDIPSSIVRGIRKSLSELQKDGYVTQVKRREGNILYHCYALTTSSPVQLFLDADDLLDFTDQCEDLENSSFWSDTLQNLKKKVDLILDKEQQETGQDTHFHFQGRVNSFSENIRNNLSSIRKLHYQDHMLKIHYLDAQGVSSVFLFSTGLFVYSPEKNQFYLLGEASDKKCILRLDSILSMEETENPCNIYESEEYLQIRDEMFSISVEDPVFVRVRFSNYGNIPAKVKNLQHLRMNTSHVYQDPGKTEFIYEDTIRGIKDFSRYLRSFGYAAVVEEPEELRDLMIQSARRTLQHYEEEHL